MATDEWCGSDLPPRLILADDGTLFVRYVAL
jgi:hypothetical protein